MEEGAFWAGQQIRQIDAGGSDLGWLQLRGSYHALRGYSTADEVRWRSAEDLQEGQSCVRRIVVCSRRFCQFILTCCTLHSGVSIGIRSHVKRSGDALALCGMD